MLTAADVEQKTFSTALRGYDLDEVDDFLDDIVATIRELNEMLEAAQAAAAAQPVIQPLTDAPAARPVEVDESAISRALIAAQEAADKLLEDAKTEAVKIVDEAKSEADTWQAERQAKRKQAQDEIAALAQRVASVRSELSVLAGEVSGKLDEMDRVIDSSGTSSELEGDEPDDEPTIYTSGSGGGHHSRHQGDPGDVKSDDLDDMLNDVASDLQMDSSNEDEDSEGSADSSETP